MRTHIVAIFSILFCGSCAKTPQQVLVVPEIFGTVLIDDKAADDVSVSIGRASGKNCSDLPKIAKTDAYGSFHIPARTEQRPSKSAILGDRIGLTFSVCFSSPGGQIYGGDFVVKTWLTKSIRIECKYPEMSGSDFTGKPAYCAQAHA